MCLDTVRTKRQQTLLSVKTAKNYCMQYQEVPAGSDIKEEEHNLQAGS